MRINRLDLNQLLCLDALLTTRSVTRAAKEVHLSQPAVSATLARLRDYFGDPILVTSGRVVDLTPFAQTLAEPVHDLLLQAQKLTRRRPESNLELVERTVTIVASDYIQLQFIAPMLERASREAPRLRFDVRDIQERLDEALDRTDVDVVVAASRYLSERHPASLLSSEGFSCIAWTGNDGIGETLSMERYLALGHVSTKLAGGKVRSIEQKTLAAMRIERRVEVEVPHFCLLPAYIVGSGRIGTLQTSLAGTLARQWPLRVLRCPVEMPDIVISMQWHRYQTHEPALLWIVRSLHEIARDAGISARRA